MNKFVVGLAKFIKVLIRPFFPFKVYGDRNIPNKKSLIVGNHTSGWDSVVYMLNTKNLVSVVYKSEFDDSRFLHWVFSGLDCIPVTRGDVDINATKSILRLLKNDKALVLFPEGHRNPTVDCLQEFHSGAALFAIKTHAPIRPFYIWDKTKPLHKNYIIFGDEFTLDEFYGQPTSHQNLEAATAIIKSKVDELRIQLNAMLEEKGVKRRKRTKKELKQLAEHNAQQALLLQQQVAATETVEQISLKDDKTDNEDK